MKETTRKTQTYVVDNIKVNLREIEWGVTNWINLAQDRDKWQFLVNTVMKISVP
jgi:hypothetical protein